MIRIVNFVIDIKTKARAMAMARPWLEYLVSPAHKSDPGVRAEIPERSDRTGRTDRPERTDRTNDPRGLKELIERSNERTGRLERADRTHRTIGRTILET
jgi:hypothetical protein